jgi:hypothetical protein
MITTKLAPPLRVDCPRDKPWRRPIMDHPVTGQRTTWQRVTTLAGMIDDTHSLTLWKMRGVAKGVAWREDLRIGAATTDDSTKEGRAALDEICEKALDTAGGGAGAAMGTAFHRVTQIADAYPDVSPESYCPPELRAELAAYTALIKAHGLRLPVDYQERTGICPDAGTAGTWDDLIQGGPSCGCGRYHVGDKKSGQHEFEYGQGKIAAQLAMYARMTTLWLATGGGYEAPPEICPEVGYVLYVPIGRPDEACVYPVDLVEGWRRVELAVAIREARSQKRGLFGAPLALPSAATDEGEEYAGLSMAQVKPKRTRRTKAQIAADAAAAERAADVIDAISAVGVTTAATGVTVTKAADVTAYLAGTSDELPSNLGGVATTEADSLGVPDVPGVNDAPGTAFLMNGELKPGPAEPVCTYPPSVVPTEGDRAVIAEFAEQLAHDKAEPVVQFATDADAARLLKTELGAEVMPADGRYLVGEWVDVRMMMAPTVGAECVPMPGTVALNRDRTVFGLVSSADPVPTHLTHMCYGLDYAVPAEMLAHAEATGQGWMHFDAGTTCPEIKISAEELRRAFVALKLIGEAEAVRPDKDQLDREREAAYAALHNGTNAQAEMERARAADPDLDNTLAANEVEQLNQAIAAARGQDDLVTAYGLWSAHWTPEHDQMAVRRLISLVGTREGLEKIWETYQQVWTDDLTAAGNVRLAELARL